MDRSPRALPPDVAVLSTLNPDGSRRWLRPRVSVGRFLTARRIVGYALIGLFTGLPYVAIGGKPAILLDLPRREFTFFGVTLLPTDTLLLALLLLGVFLAIFLVTALYGRVWCGWGCPQTVYLELVYRPIERWLDGRRYSTGGRAPVSGLRTVGKHATFVAVSLVLAHTFLSYFVGVDRLAEWMRRSPVEHPTAFLVVAATTGLMLVDFGYFREQVCTLMCPYGRFQSVLLDRDSWIVGYDPRRGEPRARWKDGTPRSGAGDCIDCHLCVATCPTGIDIRAGLQMECVGCAQCIDACDAVMDRIAKPRGLIRYSSQREIGGETTRRLRPRVVAYPALLVVVAILFGVTMAGRETADVSILRNRTRPYEVLLSGAVANTVLVKVVNRSDRARAFRVDVPGALEVASHDLPLAVAPGGSATASLRVVVAGDRFERGRAQIEVRVSDGAEFDEAIEHAVLGPLYGAP